MHGQPTATGSLLIGLESFWKQIFVIAVNKLNFKDTCLTSLPLAETGCSYVECNIYTTVPKSWNYLITGTMEQTMLLKDAIMS